MARLPRGLQSLLTVLTGKPLPGQKPIAMTPTAHLLCAALSLAAGLTISATAVGRAGWWWFLLLPGWAMTLHALRNLRMMIYHQCAHSNMWRHRRLDRVVGNVLAALLVVQSFEHYSVEHTKDHHAAGHMSLRDPTVQAMLISLRLRPGMSRRQMWRRVLATTLSPAFHLRFTVARIRSFIPGSSTLSRLLAVAGYGTVVVVATVENTWSAVVLVWLLPLLPFFQISNVLRLCVKHTFPQEDPRRDRDYYASLTNAVFIGEAAPDGIGSRMRSAVAWTRWTARMVLIHFPARYLVLTGDTVCHDFHHRYPMSREWANYIYARQRDIDGGHPGWPPYREAWGLAAAMSLVFDSLSTSDPVEYDPARVGDVSSRDLFAAFDD